MNFEQYQNHSEDFNDYLTCYEVGKIVDKNRSRSNSQEYRDIDSFYMVLGYVISQYYPDVFISIKNSIIR